MNRLACRVVMIWAALVMPSQGQPAQDVPSMLPASQVARRMLMSIRSTPCLHVRAEVETDAVGRLTIDAWMTASRVKQEIRKNGRVVHAQYASGGRIQEYAPETVFPHGSPARHVVIEYDNDAENDQWPRLAGHDLACDGVGVAGDSWLRPLNEENPTIPQMLAMVTEESEMSIAEVDGRSCYVFRSHRQVSESRASVVELAVDKATFEPVRRIITDTGGKKTTKKSVTYRLTRLPDDSTVKWGLEPRALAAFESTKSLDKPEAPRSKEPPPP